MELPDHARRTPYARIAAGVLALLALSAVACVDERKSTPAATRTLPPGVRFVTPTEPPPTVKPATPTPEPGLIEDAAFDPRGVEVTLPVKRGTFLRTVERCFQEQCLGFALPPGTPVLAPIDGRVTIGPAAADTTCSIVVSISQATDAEEGRLADPAETIDIAVGCDAALEVNEGDTVRRGDVLLKLGQRGIYEGRSDAPPTVLRLVCSYQAHGCNWAGGRPHYYATPQPGTPTPTTTPDGEVTGTPTTTPVATGTVTPASSPIPTESAIVTPTP
jgi:hypothetical protein